MKSDSKRQEKLPICLVSYWKVTLERLLTTRHCHEALANLLCTSKSESPEFLKDFEMPLRNGRRRHGYKSCIYLFRGVMKE